MPAALRTAAPALSFDIVSEPVAKVFAGFAEVAVKFAPEATVRPVAARTVARAASVRRGRWNRYAMRDMALLAGSGSRCA